MNPPNAYLCTEEIVNKRSYRCGLWNTGYDNVRYKICVITLKLHCHCNKPPNGYLYAAKVTNKKLLHEMYPYITRVVT